MNPPTTSSVMAPRARSGRAGYAAAHTAPTGQRRGDAIGRHLRHAVADGPDGTMVVELPAARSAALQLRRSHGNRFWCSTAVGGCGGELIMAAGTIRRPYFRHLGGLASKCVFAQDPARAVRSYEHVWIQQQLLGWLRGQGFTADVEHTLGTDGRTDLHVTVNGVAHSIEVQLSPINPESWADRDAGYRRHVTTVTWLYGPAASTAAAREQVNRRYALLVRHRRPKDMVEIGVRRHDGTHRWAGLQECRFTSVGLWTPHTDEAEADYSAWRRERAESDRLAKRFAERRATPKLPLTPATPTPRKHSRSPRIPPGASTASIASWRRLLPEADQWEPEVGWNEIDLLPEPERTSSRFIAYLVSTIYQSGTTDMFDLPDAGDHALILRTLEGSGMIDTFQSHGIRRWARPAPVTGTTPHRAAAVRPAAA